MKQSTRYKRGPCSRGSFISMNLLDSAPSIYRSRFVFVKARSSSLTRYGAVSSVARTVCRADCWSRSPRSADQVPCQDVAFVQIPATVTSGPTPKGIELKLRWSKEVKNGCQMYRNGRNSDERPLVEMILDLNLQHLSNGGPLVVLGGLHR